MGKLTGFVCLTLALLLLIPNSVLAAQPFDAQQLTSGKVYQVGRVDVHTISEAPGVEQANNRTIPFLVANPQAFGQAKRQAEQPGFVPPGQSSKVIMPISTTGPLVVSPVSTLPGVSGKRPNPCRCSPPDVEIGVGPNHVFEMVNLAGMIYTKSGLVAKKTFPLSQFFLLSTSSMSDPQVLYDPLSGVWFASIVNIPGGSVQFAVSATNDPTGTWIVYSTPSTGYLTDQPFIGTSNDKFVISVNDFLCVSLFCVFEGFQFWAFNKAQLVSGVSIVDFASGGPDTRFASVHPARHLSDSSGFFYMVTVGTGSSSSPASTASLLTLTGVPPNQMSLTIYGFAINTISDPPNAIQPGTSTLLVTNDDRVLSAAWQLVSGAGTLWFAANDACLIGGDSATRSCLHLFQLTTSGTTATKGFDANYAKPGTYFFYPAVSLDTHGTVAIVYGASSSTTYPSLYVTGLVPSAPAINTPILLAQGTAPDLSNRYGDYFESVSDSTLGTFWVAGEYRTSSTFQNWSTAIAQVSIT